MALRRPTGVVPVSGIWSGVCKSTHQSPVDVYGVILESGRGDALAACTYELHYEYGLRRGKIERSADVSSEIVATDLACLHL